MRSFILNTAQFSGFLQWSVSVEVDCSDEDEVVHASDLRVLALHRILHELAVPAVARRQVQLSVCSFQYFCLNHKYIENR